ncbi:capsule polysaccharide transporter [Kordiimonas sediminis]|uniref:Capsule polysaccharide transporter n=1 Tax=Kordiimonas sediminis TaxID=1735581 RepID=A0A919E6A5_9PROT|nr:capsular polysaccharide biosynthesis protein [Kordiimonas sediminis]GHF18342.1 capsule polysaccharide transporter [Kordiimonas sediminis]
MTVYATSSGILRDAVLPLLLQQQIKPLHEVKADKVDDTDIVVGWGQKDNTQKARESAAARGMPYVALEDGFFSYLSHPSKDTRRLSIVMDRSGIYYDAHSSSDLEDLLNTSADWMTDTLRQRAAAAISRIIQWRLSKYNQASWSLPGAVSDKIDAPDVKKVLVVDQTAGDMSIRLGLASQNSFSAMLDAALDENPDARIYLKVHPDVLLGRKKGHFNPHQLPDRVTVIADPCNPQALIAEMDHIYVVTSQMGFEGLLAGKSVTCFGMPFYAGWGLTTDRVTCDRRTARPDLETLFAAACIRYARYLDPYRLQLCELEDVLDILVADKQTDRPVGPRAVAVGFSLWKRGFIPEFIGPGIQKVQFVAARKLGAVKWETGDCVVLWGRKHDHLTDRIPPHVPVWRMEDGFLRSVGLGSDLRRPSSLVLDRQGIYYDAGQVSDLEAFLQTHDCTDRELARASRLRTQILAARVSKYNVGAHTALDFKAKAAGRQTILVPGQVEGDASLAYGSPAFQTNSRLLENVRQEYPDAYLVFKPHPDVLSGNRSGGVPAPILDMADEIVTDIDIIDCLDAVDAVATMTSLTGFEGLLRGKKVICFGNPFYAGWGLTEDKNPLSRRSRHLSLDALIYGALIVYPRYIRWPGGQAYGPEALVDDIAQHANGDRSVASTGFDQRVKKWIRKVSYLAAALFR